jgi:hypothetical protein
VSVEESLMDLIVGAALLEDESYVVMYEATRELTGSDVGQAVVHKIA